jgi:Protein of unknown function (DUF3179)
MNGCRAPPRPQDVGRRGDDEQAEHGRPERRPATELAGEPGLGLLYEPERRTPRGQRVTQARRPVGRDGGARGHQDRARRTLTGAVLEPVIHVDTFWFAWGAFLPDTRSVP